MPTSSHEIWINADRATVFRALTTAEGLGSWWGTASNARPEVGCVVEFDHGLEEGPMRMRITDIVSGERVAWKCVSDFTDPRNPGSEWLGHQLVFELQAGESDPAAEHLGRLLGFDLEAGELTILRFRHTGWLDGSRWYAFCNAAWGDTLNTAFKNHCEAQARTSVG